MRLQLGFQRPRVGALEAGRVAKEIGDNGCATVRPLFPAHAGMNRVDASKPLVYGPGFFSGFRRRQRLHVFLG